MLFAACTNQPSLVEYLVEQGASLDVHDSNGNTILHLCVIHSLPHMYSFCLDLWKHKNPVLGKDIVPLDKRRNDAEMTPFTLAADINDAKMLTFLMESRKVSQWSYGHVSCNLFPLDELDPMNDRDSTFKGALQIIVDSAHLESLTIPRIKDLLDTKWERCASSRFYAKFLMTCCYLFVFTVSCVLKSDKTCIALESGEAAGVPNLEDPVDGSAPASAVDCWEVRRNTHHHQHTGSSPIVNCVI